MNRGVSKWRDAIYYRKRMNMPTTMENGIFSFEFQHIAIRMEPCVLSRIAPISEMWHKLRFALLCRNRIQSFGDGVADWKHVNMLHVASGIIGSGHCVVCTNDEEQPAGMHIRVIHLQIFNRIQYEMNLHLGKIVDVGER